MKLSKKKREILRMKFGGKCAYCGQELVSRWQADHIEPVNRESKWVRQPNGRMKCVPTGVMGNPENDHEGNLIPACAACNNDKFNMSLRQWRKRLEDLPGVCERNHSAYRHAVRFGLIVPAPKKVVFHFETYFNCAACKDTGKKVCVSGEIEDGTLAFWDELCDCQTITDTGTPP
jgi:hypothetical protein